MARVEEVEATVREYDLGHLESDSDFCGSGGSFTSPTAVNFDKGYHFAYLRRNGPGYPTLRLDRMPLPVASYAKRLWGVINA